MSFKWGIIGPGKIADRFLAPAIRTVPGAVVWSVLSRDADRARDFAGRHVAQSPTPAYTDYAQLLADPELDAVLLATPDGLHAEQAVAAAKAGKHVLVEKPMATTAEGARAMVDACRAAGVKLGVAYHLRWHAGHRDVVPKIHAGAIGTLRHVRVQWTYHAPDNSNWRASDSVGRWWGLAGVGTHCLDFTRWVMLPGAGEVVEVKSLVTRPVHKGPNDETALVMLRFESGATAEIVTSVLFDSEPSAEIYGVEGSVICRGTLGAFGKGSIVMNGSDHPFPVEDPYRGEIADFMDAVRNDRPPEVDGGEGLRNVEILLKADPR